MFQKVNSAIKDVLLQVSQHPLLFFSEKGLQSMLTNRLLQYPELSESMKTGIYDRYVDKIDKLSSEREYLDGALAVPPLQREYGSGNGGRTDIVILDPKDIGNIDDFQLRSGGEYLTPLVAIELGTEKSGDDGYVNHLEKDVNNMDDLDADHKYILNVIRNKNKCKKETKTYDNKEDKLSDFREAFMNHSKKSDDIFFIGMIHHILYQEIEFFTAGKVWREEYDPLSKKFEKAVNEKFNLEEARR